jgi:hypothetical protein
MMGIDSASAAQSKRGIGDMVVDLGDGCITAGSIGGGSNISSCRSAEREPWSSGWGSATVRGFEFVEISTPFSGRGCSSSRGSVCVVAVLRSGLQAAWVLASTAVRLVGVIWVLALTAMVVVALVRVLQSARAAVFDDVGAVVRNRSRWVSRVWDDVAGTRVRGVSWGSFSVWAAISLALVAVWVLKSTSSAVVVFFSEEKCLSSGGSVWRAAHRCSRALSVWAAVWAVLGATWVLASLQMINSGSVWISASSRRTAPRHSARVCSCIEMHRPSPWCVAQTSFSFLFPVISPSFRPSSRPFLLSSSVLLHRPGPCPSASHLPRSSNSPSLVPSSIPFSRSRWTSSALPRALSSFPLDILLPSLLAILAGEPPLSVLEFLPLCN